MATAENSYFRHCTHPPESADVEELQNQCRNERDKHQRMYRQIGCNRVCLGNISVNIIHKGENVNNDDDDDDDNNKFYHAGVL